MNTPNFFLEKKRLEQSVEGKAVRKELPRRKMVHLYITCEEETAKFQAEMDEMKLKTLGQDEDGEEEREYAEGVKRI